MGDVFDFRDLRKAMVGVQRAYHIPPMTAHLLNGAMLFALAAEEAKLEVVALMSGWNPHPTHPSVVTREHWIANQLYRWMPSVDVVHINPGIFAYVYMWVCRPSCIWDCSSPHSETAGTRLLRTKTSPGSPPLC